MQTIRIALITFLTACSTSAAWAQYGLYGSPEPLRLPQSGATATDAAPVNYPATAMPTAQSAPVYSYPPQAQYAYPAQPPAMATYPQYQANTQYYYPAPASRPPLRTAAVEPAPTSNPVPSPPWPAAAAPAPALSPAPAPIYAAPAGQGSGLMNQMLNEQGAAGCANPSGGVYRGTVNQFEQAACAPPTAMAFVAQAVSARGTPRSTAWSWAAAIPVACGPPTKTAICPTS